MVLVRGCSHIVICDQGKVVGGWGAIHGNRLRCRVEEFEMILNPFNDLKLKNLLQFWLRYTVLMVNMTHSQMLVKVESG